MIEVLCKKAWDSLAVPRQRLAARIKDIPGHVAALFKHIPTRPVGIVLTVAMPLLVMTWHFVALAGRPPHLDQMAAELSSVTGFIGSPIPNNAGTRLLFAKGTENGYGIYFCDVASGQRKLLYEKVIKGAAFSSRAALAPPLLCWSPDDNFFAYSQEGQIAICDGQTGETLATVPVERPFSSGASGAWLSPQTLVFTDYTALYAIHQDHGKWSRPQPFEYFSNPDHKLSRQPIKGLFAFDTNSVVWQQGGAIWLCSEDSDTPLKIWDSTTNELMESSFSQAASKFLVHCRDAHSEFYADFYPAQIWHTARIANMIRLPPGYRPSHMTFINDGTGYAFEISPAEWPGGSVVIYPTPSHDPIQYKWQGLIKGFAVSKGGIFVISSLKGEPDEIWKYDLTSSPSDWEPVVPNVEKPFVYAAACAITLNEITNAAGEKMTYSIYAPSRPTAKRKHPLVIAAIGAGEPRVSWNLNLEAFGNFGAYVVWTGSYRQDPSQHADDDLAVYECLANRPDIDTNNVFLYGSSAGVPVVYELLEKRPELWRGAILFNALGFPDPSSIRGTRLFMVCGGADPGYGSEGSKIPMRFEDEAAKAGIPATLLINPSAGHGITTLAVTEERVREALIFLSEP